MDLKKITLAVFFIFAIYFKEHSSNILLENIYGKWAQERPLRSTKQWTFQEVYDFKTDQTVEITGRVLDSSNRVRRYVTRATAAYSIKGDSLILNDWAFYDIDFVAHTSKNKTGSSGKYTRRSYRMIYSQDTLTLSFTCPPGTACVPFPELKKIKEVKRTN